MSRDGKRRRLGAWMLSLAVLGVSSAAAGEFPDLAGTSYTARDSLEAIVEPREDARQCLAGLVWPAAESEVPCEDSGRHPADLLVRFADVRGARDAVAGLPLIDAEHIALQGTSLGGFVAANAAALDGAYGYVFLMLADGNLHELIENGEQDAAKVRTKLHEAGLSGEKLKALLWEVLAPGGHAQRAGLGEAVNAPGQDGPYRAAFWRPTCRRLRRRT